MLIPVAFVTLLLLFVATAADDEHADVSRTTVCTAGVYDPSVHAVALWVVETVNDRNDGRRWSTSTTTADANAARTCSVQAGAVLRLALVPSPRVNAGSFNLEVLASNNSDNATILLQATDVAGLRAGAARLLRELHMPPPRQHNRFQPRLAPDDRVTIPARLNILREGADTRWKVRGHQIPADHHPLQFRTQQQFTSFAQDLAVFGTNFLELSHLSLPLVAANLAAFSSAASTAGMGVSIWIGVESLYKNKTAMAETFKAMPKLDSLFFPGGDGGQLVWSDIKRVASVLHESHPDAGVWVSAQDLSSDQYEEFWGNVSTAHADGYLAGLVFGPHVRVPLTDFVARAQHVGRSSSSDHVVDIIGNSTGDLGVGGGIPVRQYPDITHTLSSQFPLSGWHPAWSLTHGRQTVCPLPQLSASIIRLRSNGSTPTVGVGAYSEGLGDDLNKAIWSAMAADSTLTPEEIVGQYARYFFGAAKASMWEKALAGLEKNWVGAPDSGNTAILQTLALLEQAVDVGLGHGHAMSRLVNSTDWRAQMYLKRGYYDAYVQGRYQCEVQGNEATAYAALSTAISNQVTVKTALATAVRALKRNCTANTTLMAWRKNVVDLTEALNKSVGVEVLGNQDTGLNVETIDTPISDAAFLLAEVATIAALPTEALQLQAIRALVHWTDAGPGGYYDYLGAPGGAAATAAAAPHLNLGAGFAADPGPTPQSADFSKRLTWSTMAMSFFDPTVVVLSYSGLSPASTYVAKVVFNAEREPATAATTAVAAAAAAVVPAGKKSRRGGGGGGGGGNSSSSSSSSRVGAGEVHAVNGADNDWVYGDFQLLANEIVQVWPPLPLKYALPPSPMQVTSVMIPKSATASGNLTLSCRQPPGLTGNGRTCQITEVWLKPMPLP